jgi:hypothetical protein
MPSNGPLSLSEEDTLGTCCTRTSGLTERIVHSGAEGSGGEEGRSAHKQGDACLGVEGRAPLFSSPVVVQDHHPLTQILKPLKPNPKIP